MVSTITSGPSSRQLPHLSPYSLRRRNEVRRAQLRRSLRLVFRAGDRDDFGSAHRRNLNRASSKPPLAADDDRFLRACPRVSRSRYTVPYAISSAAACSKVTASGIGRVFATGTAMRSTSPPSVSSPRPPALPFAGDHRVDQNPCADDGIVDRTAALHDDAGDVGAQHPRK